MFVDEIDVFVKGGDGGAGCLSFRREKYVPRGGPDGGDGGNGGSVILEAGPAITTLLAFHYQRHYPAERGTHGQGSNTHGRGGEDTLLRVPPRTTVAERVRRLPLRDTAAAAHGKGLGIRCRRHTERTRMLVHLIDLDPSTGRDPLADDQAIQDELRAYSEELAARPQIVAVNKIELPGTEESRAAVERFCAQHGFSFHAISAVTGAGLPGLVHEMARWLTSEPWVPAAR